MPKEKSANPVQAQHKADKRAALKKSKLSTQKERDSRLATRNPARLQKQIDDLRALEASSTLRPKDKQTLANLERDVKAITRARESAGLPAFRTYNDREDRRDGDRGVKRRREGSEDTDEEVRAIPMPRDTPPPVPRQHRNQKGAEEEKKEVKPVMTYSSAPVLRDFMTESKRFVPAAVRAKIAKTKGEGGLVEPEELDRLEGAGYGSVKKDIEGVAGEMEKEAQFAAMGASGGGSMSEERQGRLADRALRGVEMEEVEDEDA